MADKFFQWNKSQSQLVKGLGLGNRLEIFAAETAARYMNPYVPMRDGFLSQNYITGVDDLGGYVKYVSPYAHYQYNGTDFNFSKEQHPLATHHWDKAMMTADGDRYVNEINLARKLFII